jgi:tRNA (guanine37-N1)-methyltransferase
MSLVAAPLRVDVVSLFPAMFDALESHGISGRALERGLLTLQRWNPRDQAADAYRRVDDRPFGGGPGMVLMAEPLARTLDAIQADGNAGPVLYLSPRGRPLTQARVCELATMASWTLLCGRYEGVDERLLAARVDEEIAIGDFVVSGGELPAMMLIDAVVRWLPGAVQDAASVQQDSFVDGLLDCPHYTRPEHWQGHPAPRELMSGNHQHIQRWRRQQSLLVTARRRPDVLERARAAGLLAPDDEVWLASQLQIDQELR